MRFRLRSNEVRGCGFKYHKEMRSMDHFSGLDVSVKETSVCIVDETDRIVREVKVASEPQAFVADAEESGLPLQPDWIGNRAIVAMG
jgi:hypothetical protein